MRPLARTRPPGSGTGFFQPWEGVDNDVVVRKMEIDKDKNGDVKYIPGLETVINLKTEKKWGGVRLR